MTGGGRAGLLTAAAAVAVLAFVLLRPSDDEEPVATPDPAATQEPSTTGAPAGGADATRDEPPPEVTRLRVRGGEPVGGVARIEAEKGDTVRITVSSDGPQHIHLHGYDVIEDAAPGAPARFKFKADLEGIFEIELEGPGVQLAELRVEP